MTTHLSSTEERQPQPRLSLHQPHHNARILPDTEQSFRVAEIQRPQNLPEALPGRLRPHKLRTVMGTAVLDVSAHLDLATFEAVAPPPPPPHTSTETVHGSHPTTPTHKHRHNRNKIIFNRTTHGGATEANIDVLRNLCSPRPTRSTARRRMIAAMGVGDDDASVDVAPLCAPSVHPSSPRGALKAGGCIILTDAFMEAHRHHLRAYGRLRECLRWRRQRQTPNSPTTAAALAAAHKKPPTHQVHEDHVDEDHDGATQPRVEKITARVRRYVQQVREHQRPLLRRMESARVYGRGYYYTGAVPVADFSIVDESAVSEMDQSRISAAAA